MRNKHTVGPEYFHAGMTSHAVTEHTAGLHKGTGCDDKEILHISATHQLPPRATLYKQRGVGRVLWPTLA